MSDREWIECEHCDGEGLDPWVHDCGEDTCACAIPMPNVACRVCGGVGGWSAPIHPEPLDVPSPERRGGKA